MQQPNEKEHKKTNVKVTEPNAKEHKNLKQKYTKT